MACDDLRHIGDFQPQIRRTLLEIDVLKPDWIELCVKTTQPLPHFAAEHQERAGRLFGFSGLGQIAIQAAISPVHRIRFQQTIDAQYFEGQRPGSRESPQSET